EDAGKLGTRVIDYLNKKLGGEEFGGIEPADFFPLGGVSIEDDVAQFPESKFYCCQEKNLVIFKSNSPRSEWYKFLNSVLDVAEHYCHTKELYTIGGMVSLSAYTAPRQLLAITNSPEMKTALSPYDLARDMDYETPPGQRPTLSAYLLWAARRRNIPGTSLWVPIPSYLVSTEDPKACRKAVQFFDNRFGLGIDFRDLDEEVARQNEKIAELRNRFPELDDYFHRLESNLSLTEEEHGKLIKEIEEFLRKRD
ncbi:MAG: PAC2 family protein, partial [Dehalococcoidia bacterium]|nr:PAC2 family protein [Dehalococcoidia bacterium]